MSYEPESAFKFVIEIYGYILMAIVLMVLNPSIVSWEKIKTYQFFDVEIAIVLCVSGFLLANIWKIPHGSGIYFINYGKHASMLALALVLYRVYLRYPAEIDAIFLQGKSRRG